MSSWGHESPYVRDAEPEPPSHWYDIWPVLAFFAPLAAAVVIGGNVLIAAGVFYGVLLVFIMFAVMIASDSGW